MKISIQGNIGSFSHIAANALYGSKIELLERDSFNEVFEDLKENRADKIVIPIENSTHGSIYQNYDNLSQYGFSITKELYLKINFHLITFPHTNLSDITDIYSHPVALNQIRGFLEKHKEIKVHEYPDTAGSVKMIKMENLKSSAAAASKLAAEVYGMQVLKENIHDNKKNFTRFLALEKGNLDKELEKGKNVKVSLELELKHIPGVLYRAIGSFAEKNINLTKIESRPILHTNWEYRFYIDVVDKSEDKILKAITELNKHANKVKILGIYEEGEYLDT